MKKMEQLVSPNNIGDLFENIHAMIAVVESAGVLVSWNHAFGEYKKTNKLEDIFSQNDMHIVSLKLAIGSQEHWTAEISHSEEDLPLFCEKIESALDAQKLIERLSRQVKMYRIESEAAKKIARNKQVEMESVMVQASEVAQVDALTFLLNRRMIVRELQDEVLRAQRYNSMLSISIIDVDKFKLVNDTYGHPVGDEVLKQVACQLREHTRRPDMVGRYGGEEFLILLPNSDSNAAIEQAIRLGKEIRETVVAIKEYRLSVTVSIGIAQFNVDVDTWDTLLNRADNAMYKAKSKGRDCWVVAN
jgi:diguanylate cyclase (GGDEF)-like protein